MEEWVPNLKRQRSCAAQSNGINNWFSDRSMSTGFGSRCTNTSQNGNAATPYYQMGEPKKKGWFSKLKKITRRKKKSSEPEPDINDNSFCHSSSRKQISDKGPNKLTRSISVHIANSSGNYFRLG